MSQLLSVALVLVVAGAVLVVLGSHVHAVGRLLSAILHVVVLPARILRDWLDNTNEWVRSTIRLLFVRSHDAPETTWIGAVVLVHVIAAAALSVIALADLQLMVMTLPFMGFALEIIPLAHEVVWVVASLLVALAVFWGLVFLEAIGFTQTTPIARRSLRSPLTRYFFLASAICVAIALGYLGLELAAIRTHEAGVSSAMFQSLEVADPFAIDAPAASAAPAPQPASDTIDVLAATGHVNKILIVVSSATLYLGKWCLMPLLAYALATILSVLWLALLPFRFVLAVVVGTAEALDERFLPALLDLGHDVTRSGLDWVEHLRDPDFDRELAKLTPKVDHRAQEMGDQAVAAAAALNGHAPYEGSAVDDDA